MKTKSIFLFAALAVAAVAQAQEPAVVCEQALTKAQQAWASNDWHEVRSALAAVVADTHLPERWHSLAQLRLARSYQAAGEYATAGTIFATTATNRLYPQVHRDEAMECLLEVARLAKGMPARDPEMSRVRVPGAPTPGRVLHVAPTGSDAGDGSALHPFATVGRALEVNRAAGMVSGGTAILLAPGKYVLTKTITLSEADGGTSKAPLVIGSEKPGTAVLYGGIQLKGFHPVTDAGVLARIPAEARGKVMQCDLKALGVTNYGILAIRGCGQESSPATLELFAGGKPQTLARWPDEGFVKAGKLIEPGTLEKPSMFHYDDDRHARWTTAPDGWLFGFFLYRWADCTLPIGKIDPAAKTLATAVRYNYGMGEGQGIVYYAFNLLEEIDQPGEWYLDRAKGILYWYPTINPVSGTVELSMLSEPFLSGKGVEHLRIEGLVFDCARFNGVEFQNCSDLLIAGCTVRRVAGTGIVVNGGFRNRVVGCDIHTIGRRGTEIIGGDRPTLTRGDHVIANCRIRDFGRIDRTYTPAVQLEGVGNRVAHCLFENSPSSAMRIEGNDHVVEFNEFRKVVMESDDQGAIDMWANPTYRGVVFRYNLFTDIGAADKPHAGQGSIRFDDVISGMLVYGNVFLRAGRGFGGVQINCGRDNVIYNNLFLDCPIAVSGGYGSWNPGWSAAQSSNPPPAYIINELYRRRYPELNTMFTPPNLNFLWGNALIRCGADIKWDPSAYERLGNAIRADDPGFLLGDGLKPDIAPALFMDQGLRPIPVGEIGLYDDPFRKALRGAKP